MAADGASRPAPGRWAVVALCVLVGAVVGLLVWWTPWDVLGPGAPDVPPDPALDFTRAQITRAQAYHGELAWPAVLSWAVGLLAATALGFTRLGARLVGRIGSAGGGSAGGGSAGDGADRGGVDHGGDRRWWWTAAAGALVLVLVVRLVALPFDVWVELIRRRYGLSVGSWSRWLVDTGIDVGLTAVVAVAALVALVALARRMPRWWWAPGAALAALLVLVGTWLWPVVVEPMFHRIAPMQAGELRTSLLRIAEEHGIGVDEVLVADASRRSSAMNAYVSGLGESRRLVVYDTLLADAQPAEVRSVVAHELGHVAADDLPHAAAVGAVAAAAGTVGLAWLLGRRRLLSRAGVRSAGDPRVVALAFALAAVVGAAADPVHSLTSRQVEARADVAALDYTEDPAAFVSVQRRLAVANLTDPTPATLTYLWFADHRSSPERIALARSWSMLRGAPPIPPQVTEP